MSDVWTFVALVATLAAAATLILYALLFVARVLVLGTGALARWAARTW